MRVRRFLEVAVALNAVLLLVAPSEATTVIHIKLHQHVHLTTTRNCESGSSPMSVEGVEGVFCVAGPPCVADKNGTCPEPQEGLEFGAYCGKVKSGVLGCKPFKSKEEWKAAHGDSDEAQPTREASHGDALPACDAKNGETPMSVEGVEGVFCVAGLPCVADKNGTCPEPQEGLEFGAYCGKVKSG
ncbi:hypothetical protein ATCC90586_010982 [Pythium insidiosum]|nr:hypothetical protein ATCC90586_010982 [Pythium insidiosum]